MKNLYIFNCINNVVSISSNQIILEFELTRTIYGGLMYTSEVTVKNEIGLHARPGLFFIQKANEFTKCDIWIEKDNRRVSAKDLKGVLCLGIVGGMTVRLIADGKDDEVAVTSLVRLIESGFAEKYR